MAISSQGATFAFSGISGLAGSVLSISIEEAQPEIVDMTTTEDPAGVRRLVRTGDIKTPPKVSIVYLRSSENLDFHPPASLMDVQPGLLSIGHASGFAIQRNAFVESASTEMAVGEFIRGRVTFIIDTSVT